MTFQTHLRVRYADTDAQGVVYNGAFFTYLEVARFEMIEQILVRADAVSQLWESLAVKEITITYHAPLHFPDRFVVRTSITHLGTRSAHLEHNIVLDDGWQCCRVSASCGRSRER